MTEDKKQKLKMLRQRLANLSESERKAISDRGLVTTIDGHSLSLHNTLLVNIQSEKAVSVVGGYQQWRKAGKQVKRGEHGLMIWFPIGNKNENDEVSEVTRYFTAYVFDISQVEAVGQEAQPVTSIMPVKVEPKQEPQVSSQQEPEYMKEWSLV